MIPLAKEKAYGGGEHAAAEPDGVPLHAVRDDIDVNGGGLWRRE